MNMNARQMKTAGDELVAWVANYDAHGRTYRQFWADYSVAAGAFEALCRDDDASPELADLISTVREFPKLLGYEPEAIEPRPDLDDLIAGRQRAADGL